VSTDYDKWKNLIEIESNISAEPQQLSALILSLEADRKVALEALYPNCDGRFADRIGDTTIERAAQILNDDFVLMMGRQVDSNVPVKKAGKTDL
jgi:hypothetical protein